MPTTRESITWLMKWYVIESHIAVACFMHQEDAHRYIGDMLEQFPSLKYTVERLPDE